MWNLINNAQTHALSGDSGVRISVTGGFAKDAKFANIDVIDNGNGVPTENVRQLFEPFFTSSSQGTGLGLYVSRELCINNGGSLEYIPQKKDGSCFRIKLPTL